MDAVRGSFSVGSWVVDPGLHQLSVDGRVLKIEPKAMALLCHLAARPGQVVSREALLAAVWPGVIVGDDALTQVVVKLRRALGDKPDEPAYIETIPKGGYRLVAPVGRPGGAEVPARRPIETASKRALPRIAGAVAGLAAVVALASWVLGGFPRAGSEKIVPASASSAVPTLAIRTFEALGDDPQELLLARGVTEDLTTDLSKLSGLRVIRVEPDFGLPAPELNKARLPIRYRVSGSVMRRENRVRLQVHLADAVSGAQLWSERFEVAATGLFEVQDKLAERIVALLPVKVSEAERRRLAARYTHNLEAYETFQRGQFALQTRRRDDNERARDLFLRAIALDAEFARAYAGLAMTYTAEFRNRWVRDGGRALDHALELARTAYRINPEIPETCWVLAFVYSHRHEHSQALRFLDEALRLNPSFADGYALKGAVLTSIGQAAEGLPLLHDALRLSPQSGYAYFMLLGRAYLALGQLEQARINLKHALKRNPEFIDARAYLAVTYVAEGDATDAEWEADEIRVLDPAFTAATWLASNPTADSALKAKLLRSLESLGL